MRKLFSCNVTSLQKDISATGRLFGGLLSVSKRNGITSEVDTAKKLFNLNIWDNKESGISNIFQPLLFQKLVSNIKNACPTITNILEQLVLTHNTSRNTLKNREYENESCCAPIGILIGHSGPTQQE
jgi:hypothetical protein